MDSRVCAVRPRQLDALEELQVGGADCPPMPVEQLVLFYQENEQWGVPVQCVLSAVAQGSIPKLEHEGVSGVVPGHVDWFVEQNVTLGDEFRGFRGMWAPCTNCAECGASLRICMLEHGWQLRSKESHSGDES